MDILPMKYPLILRSYKNIFKYQIYSQKMGSYTTLYRQLPLYFFIILRIYILNQLEDSCYE